MEILVGDILTMKKAHPCGEKRWLVLSATPALRLRCLGCGHEVVSQQFKTEKNIRSIQHAITGKAE
jgi:hypothetical protein